MKTSRMLITALSLLIFSSPLLAQKNKPNIIFLFADSLGLDDDDREYVEAWEA